MSQARKMKQIIKNLTH